MASSSNYRDASGSRWQKDPTPIAMPTNAPPGAHNGFHSAPSASNSRNPFNVNPNRNINRRTNTKGVGNQTSGQTLLGARNGLIQSDGPPQKRLKMDQPWESSKSQTFRLGRQGTNGKNRSPGRPRLAPEDPIDVDAEDIQEYPQGFNHHNRQSSDELNLRSSGNPSPEAQTSKYPFGRNHKATERDETPAIIPDGESTKWAESQYSGLADDPIQSYISDDPGPSKPIGRVEMLKQKYEPKKVDLRKEQKPSLKMKMKPKFPNIKPQDPIATSSTAFIHSSRAIEKEIGSINIDQIYLDATLFSKSTGQNVEMFWTSGSKLTIKSDDTPIFCSNNIAEEYASVSHATSGEVLSNPVIQLQPANTSTPSTLITMKFDTADSRWRPKKYGQFLEWLASRNLESLSLRHTDPLWEIAKQQIPGIKAEQTKRINREDNSRNKEVQKILARRQPDLGPPPSIQLGKRKLPRYTPSPGPSSSIKVRSSRDATPKEKNLQPNRTNISHQDANAPSLRRSSRNVQAKNPQPVDQDEIILAYPQGVPGAVNITNADLARLRPGEYLNDTLIEFGLKFWLKELEIHNPDLADQIHVFNSFFYKKLNHKKDAKLAFESVRKWTAKFDLFKKKYIIVPINEHFHWYLAVIYEPEHILQPGLPHAPSTRHLTRMSITHPEKSAPTEAQAQAKEDTSSMALVDEEEGQHITSSEAEVEYTLNEFQSSCTIGEPDAYSALLFKTDASNDANNDIAPSSPLSDLSYTDNDESTPNPLRPLSPTVSDYGRDFSTMAKRMTQSGSVDEMVVDADDTREDIKMSKIPALKNTIEVSSGAGPIDPKSFYQPAGLGRKAKGKRKADPDTNSVAMEVEESEDGVIVVNENETPSKTHIFTFDSLGTAHPQAVRKLATYLKLEAKDKKGIDEAGLAKGKTALVPVQPNFCDCGLYLIHFAQTFMTDPQRYCQIVLSQKSKSATNKDRQDVWHDEKVADMREELAKRIRELAHDWKKDRVTKDEAMKREALEGDAVHEISESSSEIDILETTTPAETKISPKRKGTRYTKATLAAARMRG